MAEDFDLEVKAGATYRLVATWEDPTGAPIPLSGYQARLRTCASVGAPTLFSVDSAVTSACASLDVEPDGATGQVHLRIGATITATLRRGFYDLELYMPSDPDEVERLASGRVKVTPDPAP